MIGGPPIPQPYYPYQYPAQGYVQPQQLGALTQPRSPGAFTQPGSPAAAPPVARGQIPDEPPAPRPAPPKLDMPTPEALGVATPVVPPSWTELRLRLDRMGATGFDLGPATEGGYRFRCQVPTASGPRTIEGRGATEAEAVQRALQQVGR